MRTLLFLFIVCLTVGCTQVNQTNRLMPGMTADQVRAMMGEPSQTQFVNNTIVWKYSLHQPWVGFKSYYLAFDQSQKLVAWASNEAEFARNQAMMLNTLNAVNQTFPPKRKYEVEIKRK